MARRRQPCDVPGCNNERYRWQRLCDSCFAALPHRIRARILDTWKYRDRKEHHKACRDAGRFFAERTNHNDDFGREHAPWMMRD